MSSIVSASHGPLQASSFFINRKGELLAPTTSRFVLFPIRHPEIWKSYKDAQAVFWTAAEVNLSVDYEHWTNLLSVDERAFLSNILAFFAAADGIVVDNLAERFCSEVQLPEARCFYGFQIAMENIHSEVYSRLLTELVVDESERARLLDGIDTIPSVKAKSAWCMRWINDPSSDFPTRLVAFAIVEGVFFSSSFAAIFWFRERKLMPGLTFSNELISRDEGLHMRFACLLYQLLGRPVASDVVQRMMREAVALEQSFFVDSLPRGLVGMNARLMSQYVRFIGDYVLSELGVDPIFGKANPFPFMETMSVSSRANFFDRSISDYLGAAV